MKKPRVRTISLGRKKNSSRRRKFLLLVLSTDERCMNRHCKRATHAIQAHHIIYRSQLGSDDISNGIALCSICHHRVHNGYADKKRGRITGKQFMLWILRQWLSTDAWRWDEAYGRLLNQEYVEQGIHLNL